ncbi:hypothetical protein ACLOJK_014460 [Asimina triloba]
MAGEKGRIFIVILASIRQCYGIPKEVELLATDIDELLRAPSGAEFLEDPLSRFMVRGVDGVLGRPESMDDSFEQEAIRGKGGRDRGEERCRMGRGRNLVKDEAPSVRLTEAETVNVPKLG